MERSRHQKISVRAFFWIYTSIKIPSTPTATAVLAMQGINSRRPPLATPPPSNCFENEAAFIYLKKMRGKKLYQKKIWYSKNISSFIWGSNSQTWSWWFAPFSQQVVVMSVWHPLPVLYYDEKNEKIICKIKLHEAKYYEKNMIALKKA